MWEKKSKLELFSLTMDAKSDDKVIKELVKRLEKDVCFSKELKNRWIKRLKQILEIEDYRKEDAINRVLKSIYDYGDALRIWVS